MRNEISKRNPVPAELLLLMSGMAGSAPISPQMQGGSWNTQGFNSYALGQSNSSSRHLQPSTCDATTADVKPVSSTGDTITAGVNISSMSYIITAGIKSPAWPESAASSARPEWAMSGTQKANAKTERKLQVFLEILPKNWKMSLQWNVKKINKTSTKNRLLWI